MSSAEFDSSRLSLRQLRDALGGEIVGFESVCDARCYDVRVDSREVSLGSLFVALPGTALDGREYALDAARRGASAMLTPTLVEEARREAPDMVQWVHPDARRVAGFAASLLRGEPSRDLFTVGVTGTNGKTTVCHLVQQILQHCGMNAGVLGTAGHSIAAVNESEKVGNENFAEFKLENVAATHTTSDGPTLQRLLEQHRRGGGDAVALELSSHALDQQRHAGLEVDVAVYTNLTREHLDYHGSLDEYARAKAELFSSLRPGAVAVINAQASHAEVMIDAATQAGARIVTY
ncbi:MAG: Mur ligase family protein, partial [Planctomycetota bacterium]